MADIRGFIIGRIIAENNDVTDEDEENRIGLIAALMPSPLLGAVVATLVLKERDEGRDDGRGIVARADGGEPRE